MRSRPLPGWVVAEVRPIATTPVDPDAQEVVSEEARGATVFIRCIISIGTRRTSREQSGGNRVRTAAFRCRKEDARLRGWTPRDGDLIVAVRDRLARVVSTDRMYLAGVVASTLGPDGSDDWEADLATEGPARRTV